MSRPWSYVKAQMKQGGDLRLPAQLHQGQIMSDQSGSFLQWSDGIGEQRKNNWCHLPGLLQGC